MSMLLKLLTSNTAFSLIPDSLYALLTRKRLAKRLEKERAIFSVQQQQSYVDFLLQSPITVDTQAANEQHYEVPTTFYDLSLGQYKKYSSCYWDDNTHSLDAAEENMLLKYLDRADIQDHQEILDMGCGWGSFTLFAAQKFPNSNFTALSNSTTQRAYIEAQADILGLKNITVITGDIANIELDKQFDRIVSIEMLEHVRNYHAMFEKISRWLTEDGYLFVHIFIHSTYSYLFDGGSKGSFTANNFFTGGQMPSRDLFSKFDTHLAIKNSWDVNGIHYQKTAQAWLDNMDANKPEILKCFNKSYGKEARKYWYHWRLFYLICVETFGYNRGSDWLVTHYLFQKNNRT